MSVYDDVIAKTENIDKVKKVVVSLSGGLDSTTLLYLMVKKFGKENVYALSFDYKQRHKIELTQAKKSTGKLGVNHKVVDISFLGEMARDFSAMVEGSVATPTMEDVLGDPQPSTYMPNRNMILASIAASYAEITGSNGIALGLQAIDAYNYFDTSPEFYEAIQNVFKLNRKFPITFITPFITLNKTSEIVLGRELGVDLELCWTCYSPIIDKEERVLVDDDPMGGHNYKTRRHFQPCGTCPSCFERAQAFKKANIIDPVVETGVWD
jgi:7-cyano-7-deazaguanine synthase